MKKRKSLVVPFFAVLFIITTCTLSGLFLYQALNPGIESDYLIETILLFLFIVESIIILHYCERIEKEALDALNKSIQELENCFGKKESPQELFEKQMQILKEKLKND